jgi:hypothetical protein
LVDRALTLFIVTKFLLNTLDHQRYQLCIGACIVSLKDLIQRGLLSLRIIRLFIHVKSAAIHAYLVAYLVKISRKILCSLHGWLSQSGLSLYYSVN